MTHRTLAAAIAILALGAGTARAQGTGTPAPNAHPRQGMLIGFGLGGGNIWAECVQDSQNLCNETLESGSVDFHVGTMLAPRLGLMFDLWPMAYHDSPLTITHTIATGAARYWLTPRLWIQGGVGGANVRIEYKGVFIQDETRTDTVFAVMGAAGYEILLRNDFALDLQLRGGTGFYQDNEAKGHSVALEVGFTWY